MKFYKCKLLFIISIIWVLLLFKVDFVLSHSSPENVNILNTGEDNIFSSLLILIGFLLFICIILLGIWLLKQKESSNNDPITYLDKIQTFKRNARLYIIHIQGMSLTYGVRSVLFTIYILYLFPAGIYIGKFHFEPILFIGILFAIGSIISGIVSTLVGIVVDSIGKKWSFISGDFIGSLTILSVVFFPTVENIIAMQIVRVIVMSAHNIAEGPFIYEQSSEKERVHLFSVSSGMSTLANMSGNLIGGVVPLLIALILFNSTNVVGSDTIFVIQIGLIISVLLWWGSLIPAFLMKEEKRILNDVEKSISARLSFKNVSNWGAVSVFVLNSVFLGLGGGMFVSFFAIFFLEYILANVSQISIIFALGSLFIALGNLASPILADKFGKVSVIVYTRLISIPFMILLPFSINFSNTYLSPVFLAGLFYILRDFLTNATGPTESALAMEIITDQERTTMESLRIAGGNIFSGIGFLIGGYFMSVSDFVSPFILASILYMFAIFVFWYYFRNNYKKEKVVSIVNVTD